MRVIISFLAVLLPLACLMGGVFGSFLFTFSVPVLWEVGLRGNSMRSLGFRVRYLWFAVAVGGGSGLVLGGIGGGLLRLFGMTGLSLQDPRSVNLALGPVHYSFHLKDELGARLLLQSNTFSGMILYVLFMLAVIGLGEELFWRGFIQQKLARRFTKHAAIVTCAALFAMVHCYLFLVLPVSQGLVFLAIIMLAGITWGYLYEHTGNIVAPAFSHGIAAFIIWKYFFFTA